MTNQEHEKIIMLSAALIAVRDTLSMMEAGVYDNRYPIERNQMRVIAGREVKYIEDTLQKVKDLS